MTQLDIRFYPIERALSIIRPICQIFTAEGAKVKVVFVYTGASSDGWSLNEALTQPTDTWKENLAKILDEVRISLSCQKI